MKKKWILIVIGLLLVAGIGGKMYMDKREEQQEAEKIEAERMSVVALKNTFANIKSVEFKYIDFNVMTGSYGMVVSVSNIEDEIAEFDYSYSKGVDEISNYKIVDEQKVQIEGKTTGKVKVIYSNGEEGEV